MQMISEKQVTKESVLEKLQSKNFVEDCKQRLIETVENPAQIIVLDRFLSDEKLCENEFLQRQMSYLLEYISSLSHIPFVYTFLSSEKLYENEKLEERICEILYHSPFEHMDAKTLMLQLFLEDEKISNNEFCKSSLYSLVDKTSSEEETIAKIRLMKKIASDEKFCKKEFGSIYSHFLNTIRSLEQSMLAEKFFSDPKLYENEWLQKNIRSIILSATNQARVTFVDKFVSDSNLYENEWLQQNIKRIIYDSFVNTFDNEAGDAKIDLIYKYTSDPKLYKNEGLQKNICSIIDAVDTLEKAQAKIQLMDKFLSDPKFYENEELQKAIGNFISVADAPEKVNLAYKLLDDIASCETAVEIAVSVIENYESVSYRQVQKLEKTIGQEFFSKIYNNPTDVVAAANLIGLFGKSNINEISITDKRNVLRAIVKNNTDLFGISADLKQAFPLIPTSQEEYCTLLPSLVKSLGIEVKKLDEAQVQEFNANLSVLGSSLSQLSDAEFNELELSNSYSKDEFINDTLFIIDGLSKVEKQKVYDYFGFELHHNKKAPTGYSITGYPVNINNGVKLSQITDEETKQVVEQLRPKVVMFSETNTIQSNNEKVAKQIDKILEKLPELRSTIGKNQFGAHEFDVMKHSLKVMQKIVQNPNCQKLDESDKKLMLLASLLHDISKAEIKPDPTHNFESSFDAFYIAKKFNLTKEEEIKLYTLINHHEWLKHVNKEGLSDEERTKRLQSVAFDLQNDNLFEMSKIFTEADLKGIDGVSIIYDKYGSALEKHSEKVEEYILELKKSKPILPTTKLAKADDIQSRITVVNDDCSTNLKGVYLKDGLVVVKYNEVEDWKSLGFPEGSISRGIETVNPIDNSPISTGNIKFIAHGLDFANQLSNFDAFALPDSDALLSVSYMERPESKYRLFRTQGVLLDVDSKYVHGGGETDAGSGCGKNINTFKDFYLFGGERQGDRDYISDLIKDTLKLTDSEYVAFVEANQNKSMLEIEPVEAREALIKKFALINSNTRRGDRAYNEMYVSNPKVQGCFAYSEKDDVENIPDFMELQPEFLKEYAKENNLPFFVFGD